eukprot:Em0018g36a
MLENIAIPSPHYYTDVSFIFDTLALKVDASGKPTISAHPARFSPDDQFSRQRITLKKRFGLLPTQNPHPYYS